MVTKIHFLEIDDLYSMLFHTIPYYSIPFHGIPQRIPQFPHFRAHFASLEPSRKHRQSKVVPGGDLAKVMRACCMISNSTASWAVWRLVVEESEEPFLFTTCFFSINYCMQFLGLSWEVL